MCFNPQFLFSFFDLSASKTNIPDLLLHKIPILILSSFKSLLLLSIVVVCQPFSIDTLSSFGIFTQTNPYLVKSVIIFEYHSF